MEAMRSYIWGVLIAFVFFITQVVTLSDYGMNEDSPFHFMAGQYYLERLLKGRVDFPLSNRPSPILFVPGQRISLYKPNPSEGIAAPLRSITDTEDKPTSQKVWSRQLTEAGRRESFYKHNAWTGSIWDGSQMHPAISDMLRALVNRLFYEKWGILGDVEAYHFYGIIVTTLLIFFVYLFAHRAFGTTCAIFAASSTALFPFFFSESHFNLKDTVQASFFTIALVSFYFWLKEGFRLKWFIVFLACVFLALGTKWNIGFLPFILLPWIILNRKKEEVKQLLKLPRLFIYGIISLTVPFFFLIVSWPWFWGDTFLKIDALFDFYTTMAVRDPQIDVPLPFSLPLGFNATGILRVISMTPPAVLFLFMGGLLFIFTKRVKSAMKEEWLVFFWLLIPLLRASRQWMDLTGSIRQFIEYLPAFAIMAGIGGQYILENLISKFRIKHSFIIYNLSFIILLIIPIVRTHPNENVYFNFLAGGLKGAEKSDLYAWQGTYDNVYRQGVNWLNKNAPQSAKLAYLDGTMLAISPLWLREDIRFGSFFSGFDKSGEFVISLSYPTPPAVFPYHYLSRFLIPLHTVSIDGVTLLTVWQNDKRFIKTEYLQQQKVGSDLSINRYTLGSRKLWEISFPKTQKVTRLIIDVPPDCFGRRGIWSTLEGGRETFINPQISLIEPQKLAIDFPAQAADIIRFWDVEGESCVYQAKAKKLYAL